MPPSKCPDMTPREVDREAGCERVETSGLLRPNLPVFSSSSEQVKFTLKNARGETKTARAWGALAVGSAGD